MFTLQNPNQLKGLKLLLLTCYVMAVSYLYWYINGYPLMGIDDANIYFVYMKNVSEGNGFVYNMGGEHVEGFTSLLWCLLGSFFFLISSRPELFLLIINFVLITFSLWKFICFLDDSFQSKSILSPFSFFVVLALAIIPGYFDWTILSLLETGLWSSLLLLTTVVTTGSIYTENHVKKNRVYFNLLLVLMVFTRPESYFWAAGFMTIFAARIYFFFQKDWLKTSKFILPSLAILLMSITTITSWRLYYFGYPFPNTYYAKVSQDIWFNIHEGYAYIVKQIMAYNPLLLFIPSYFLIYFLGLSRQLFKLNDIRTYFLILTVITLCIPLYTGGDHFRLGRFLQPSIPILYACMAIALYDIFCLINKKLILAVYFFSGIILLFSARIGLHHNLRNSIMDGGAIIHEFDIGTAGREFGAKLSDFFSKQTPYPSQGLLTAGGNALTYKGRSIDLLGLNNVEMAHAQAIKNGMKNHAAFNKDVFYNQKPDIFWTTVVTFIPLADTATFELPETTENYKLDFYNLAYQGILYDSLFRQEYEPLFIIKNETGECLFTYANKHFYPTLNPAVYTYKIIPRD